MTRRQSFREEVANTVSHGFGLVAGLAAAPYLLVDRWQGGDVLNFTGAAIFLSTLVLVYVASILYHSAPVGRAKKVFRTLDQGAIFLFVAGTYTPFALGVLRGGFGWSVLVVAWSTAAAGLVLLGTGLLRRSFAINTLYLAMGWLGLFVLRPLWEHVPLPAIALLVAGGVAYTIGVGFLCARRLKYRHLIWHLWVIAGTMCHFVAVLLYAH